MTWKHLTKPVKEFIVSQGSVVSSWIRRKQWKHLRKADPKRSDCGSENHNSAKTWRVWTYGISSPGTWQVLELFCSFVSALMLWSSNFVHDLWTQDTFLFENRTSFSNFNQTVSFSFGLKTGAIFRKTLQLRFACDGTLGCVPEKREPILCGVCGSWLSVRKQLRNITDIGACDWIARAENHSHMRIINKAHIWLSKPTYICSQKVQHSVTWRKRRRSRKGTSEQWNKIHVRGPVILVLVSQQSKWHRPVRLVGQDDRRVNIWRTQ